MIVLGIETSCDETAASICKDGKIISSIVSQQFIHSTYGGVIPEIASREHEKLLNKIVNHSVDEAKIKIKDINVISVTNGPGLSGALLTGISFAKGLGLSLDIPVIPVNHLEAHIFSNFLADPTLKFPFICLLVSGGHTQLWNIKSMDNYKLLGETRDDAAGEAFDKGARILGLGYPGGPEIEREAKTGNPNKIQFPRSLMEKKSLEFSFSGLKTSLLYFMDDFQEDSNITINDIIASYQQAIIDVLVEKLKRAILHTKVNNCVIAGGVASNNCLREQLKFELSDINIVFPDLSYCTDNAAMVSYLGHLKIQSNLNSPVNFTVSPNLKLV